MRKYNPQVGGDLMHLCGKEDFELELEREGKECVFDQSLLKQRECLMYEENKKIFLFYKERRRY